MAKTEQTILEKLSAPMPFQWRVQSAKEYGATCVAYIDSRQVTDRLNEVLGLAWESDFKEVSGTVYGGIGVEVEGRMVWKWDAGSESEVEAEKGQASDAFKRAAVKWGVGRFLYEQPIVKLKTKKHTNGKYYPTDSLGNIIWDGIQLTDYINKTSKPKELPSKALQPIRGTLLK